MTVYSGEMHMLLTLFQLVAETAALSRAYVSPCVAVVPPGDHLVVSVHRLYSVEAFLLAHWAVSVHQGIDSVKD